MSRASPPAALSAPRPRPRRAAASAALPPARAATASARSAPWPRAPARARSPRGTPAPARPGRTPRPARSGGPSPPLETVSSCPCSVSITALARPLSVPGGGTVPHRAASRAHSARSAASALLSSGPAVPAASAPSIAHPRERVVVEIAVRPPRELAPGEHLARARYALFIKKVQAHVALLCPGSGDCRLQAGDLDPIAPRRSPGAGAVPSAHTSP